MTSSHRHSGPSGPHHPRDDAAYALTPLRRQVLDALRAEGRPLGAYDIIARIGGDSGKSLAPVSVYRALDHLLKQGLAHRLASRNAFLACGHGHCAEESVAFLICETCGDVAEAVSHSLKGDLATLAASAGFAARSETIEISGRCARCRSPA